jgi:DNA-binding NarL/FixJ family response regulator
LLRISIASMKTGIALFSLDEELQERFEKFIPHLPHHHSIGKISHVPEILTLIHSQKAFILLLDPASFTLLHHHMKGQKLRQYVHISFIVIAEPVSYFSMSQAIFHGVVAIIHRETWENGLINALQSLQSSMAYIDRIFIRELEAEHLLNPLKRDMLTALTQREMEVLDLILKEKSNTIIAEKLYISSHTVNSHRKNIFRKMKVKSIVGLVKKLHGSEIRIQK